MITRNSKSLVSRSKWVSAIFAVGFSLSSIALRAEECKFADHKAKPLSRVAVACKKGGVKAARKTMKELRDAANAKLKPGDKEFKCDSCHDTDNSDDEFTLRKDARESLKRMMAVIEGK